MDTAGRADFGAPAEMPLAAAIVRLIEDAHAVFETNHSLARECISRAANLLRAQQRVSTPRAGVAAGGSPAGGLAPWQIKQVIAYIDSQIGSAITASVLSQLTKLSAGHFFRAFKVSFGVPPRAYITAKRIECACAMLAQTDERLCQIAIACGLCDQSHLCRMFRRTLGVSPEAWRRANYVGPSGPHAY